MIIVLHFIFVANHQFLRNLKIKEKIIRIYREINYKIKPNHQQQIEIKSQTFQSFNQSPTNIEINIIMKKKQTTNIHYKTCQNHHKRKKPNKKTHIQYQIHTHIK